MIFAKAYAELLKGNKVRRKEWEPLTHLRLVDNEVIAFRGEITNYYEKSSVLFCDNWLVVDGDGKKISFIEALDELNNKKCITREEWPKGVFVFLDKDSFAICRPMEFDFMPTAKCFRSTDWEIMK